LDSYRRVVLFALQAALSVPQASEWGLSPVGNVPILFLTLYGHLGGADDHLLFQAFLAPMSPFRAWRIIAVCSTLISLPTTQPDYNRAVGDVLNYFR
jgi:hypothetical protein